MTLQVSHREKLQVELLKSEWVRTVYVVGAISIVAAVYSIRLAVFESAVGGTALFALFCLAIVEIAAYFIVSHTSGEKRTLSTVIWVGILLGELSVPTLAIALFRSSQVPSDFRALANPWVLILFLIIIASTLRLTPWLSRLAGFLSASLYLAAAYQHGWRPALMDPAFYTVPHTGVLLYAVILLTGGWMAGAVAGQIRKHVEAALSAAETRHQLQQIQHDLDLARTIQQSLLPSSAPRLQGFEIAGWNQPADATGGDFFDWQQLGEGKLAVMLADVTGHGIGPALLAAACRAYAKASFNTEVTLGATVQQINRLLAADLTPPHYATFVAAVCDQEESTIELFSAGHGPIFAFSVSDDSFKEIDSQSIPLGLIPELGQAPPALLHMKCGDMLFLLTDGFVEWENIRGEEFGLQRVMNTLRPLHNLSPEQMITELYQSVLNFTEGTPQKDDLTAIIIKRNLAPIAVGGGSAQITLKQESIAVAWLDSSCSPGQIVV